MTEAKYVTSGSSSLPLDLVSWVGFEVVWEDISVKPHEELFVLGVTDGCL